MRAVVLVTQSHSHTVTQSHSHTVTQSHSHTVTQSHSHTVTQSHTHTLTHSHTHTLTHSHTHTITHSVLEEEISEPTPESGTLLKNPQNTEEHTPRTHTLALSRVDFFRMFPLNSVSVLELCFFRMFLQISKSVF